LEDSVVVWPVPVTVLAVFGVNVDNAELVIRESILGFAEVISTDTEGIIVDFVKPSRLELSTFSKIPSLVITIAAWAGDNDGAVVGRNVFEETDEVVAGKTVDEGNDVWDNTDFTKPSKLFNIFGRLNEGGGELINEGLIWLWNWF